MAYAISKSPTTIRAIRSADPTLLMMRHPFESCGQLLPALISSPHGGTLMWVKSGPEKDVETEGQIKSRGRSSCHAINHSASARRKIGLHEYFRSMPWRMT